MNDDLLNVDADVNPFAPNAEHAGNVTLIEAFCTMGKKDCATGVSKRKQQLEMPVRLCELCTTEVELLYGWFGDAAIGMLAQFVLPCNLSEQSFLRELSCAITTTQGMLDASKHLLCASCKRHCESCEKFGTYDQEAH